MRTLYTLIFTMLLGLLSPAMAALQAGNTECAQHIDVKVNGLVCDFCARALEKVFGKRDEVATIKVDLNNGEVIIDTKPGKTLDDETLKQLITDSGYNVTSINKGC